MAGIRTQRIQTVNEHSISANQCPSLATGELQFCSLQDVDSANILNYQDMFPLNEDATVYVSNPQEGLQGSPLQNSD